MPSSSMAEKGPSIVDLGVADEVEQSKKIDNFTKSKLNGSPGKKSMEASDDTATSSTPDSGSKRDDETLTGNDKDLNNDQNTSSTTNDFKDIAAKLYNEEFVLINPAEYTQFLAAPDSDSSQIREYYMDMFNWDASLMTSTRRLCLKLYLKGESQEIDRILSSFTKSYLKQHPKNVFCTRDFEKIYIVLYSLILLNTALHNSEVNKKSKISQADYIKNTLTTFLQQNRKALKALSIKQKIQIERELNLYYEDLSHHELLLKTSDENLLSTHKKASNDKRYSRAETIRSSYYQVLEADPDKEQQSPRRPESPKISENNTNELSRQNSNGSIWSNDYDTSRRISLSIKRITSGASSVLAISTTHSTFSRPAKDARFGFTRALTFDANSLRIGAGSLRNYRSYDQLRQGHPLTGRLSRASIMTNNSTTSNVNDDTLSLIADDVNLNALEVSNERGERYQLEDFDVDDFQDKFDLKLELQGAPYLKEGLLKLRILHNDLADSVMGEPLMASSAALASSLNTTKLGFMSFFSRPFAREPVAAPTVGTSSSKVFLNKFTEYFVVVSKGELRLYSFDPKLIKKQQNVMKKLRKSNVLLMFEREEPSHMGDGNWLKNAANIGNYNLCSTIAHLEKLVHQSSSGKKNVYWSLTFPKVTKREPKKFIFEAGTAEVASEFINTCNFWASKITAIPTMEESVSSLEYGWTNLDRLVRLGDGFKKTKSISKWDQLPKGVYLSNYVISHNGEDEFNHEGILKQFVQTLKYYNNLKGLYNNFNRGKTTFMKKFKKCSSSSNYKLITSNYEARLTEYKRELGKYKSYLVSLGYGLKLRFDAEDDDKDEQLIDELKANDPELSEEKILEAVQKKRAQDKEAELDLTKVVKLEIEKLISTSSEMQLLLMNDPKYAVDDLARSKHEPEVHNSTNSLVKSPRTFTLSNFKEIETSPVYQLLSAEGKHFSGDNDYRLHQAKSELIMSFSTNTIKEENESEEHEN